MADSEVKVVISGEAQGVTAAMQAAASSVREGVLQMKESLSTANAAFAGLSESFLAIGAVFAGGAAFKEIVAQTKAIASEAINLGRSLGISASAASIYNVALEEVGGGSDDMAAASKGLTRQLKTNEKGLNDMGIATRDAQGHLLDMNTIMFNAIAAVNSYSEGTDRNLAAQTAFGRGANANSAVLKLTQAGMQEAADTAKELGLIVGVENIAAYKENVKATAGATAVMHGMEKAIGDALLPVLTQLAQWFRDVGPIAVGLIKGAIGGLVTSFWELVAVGKIVGEVIAASFMTLSDTMEGLFQAIGLAMQGKFTQAGQALKSIGTNVATDWKVAFSHMTDDAKDAATKIKNLFSEQTEAAAPAAGKAFDLKPKGSKGPDNRLAEYKNELDLQRQAADDFDHKDIAADLAFWQQKLAITTGGSKEDEKLRAEIAKNILGLQKKQHDDEIKQQEEAIKTSETLALGEVDAKKQALAQEFALGQITRQQEVQAEIALENEKFKIQQAAIEQRLSLAKFDLLGQQKLKDDELKLEQKHATDVQKIVDKEVLDEQKVWQNLFKSMESGFASTIQSFLKGTTSLGGAVKGLFQDITSSVIQSLAQMAAKNLEVMLESMLLHKTAAMQGIKANAASGAAAAYQAVVGIPYVGPFLAPAAAALAYGAILAFGASASAAGGYDIPAGVNPVTQLHQQEMVLPAKYANVIRGMAGGSGGGGTTVQINAIDARSLQKALTGSGSSGPLAVAIRGLGSRFAVA